MRKKNLIQVVGGLAVVGACSIASAIPFDNTNSVVARTATLGGTTPDYATLGAAAAAFDAVSGGINAPWTLLVQGDTTELATAQIGLANTFGVNGKLTIKPAPSTVAKITLTSTATPPGTAFFGLLVIGSTAVDATVTTPLLPNTPSSSGAYVIDGSNTVGGTTRDLTFAAGEVTALATPSNRLIRIVGDTDNMIVKNTNFVFNDSAGSAPCIGLGAGNITGTDFAPDGLTITNCSFSSAQIAGSTVNGFGLDTTNAASGTLTSGTTIQNLTIQDCVFTVDQRGIFMNGVGTCLIQRNTITIANSAASTATQGIFHFNSNSNTGYTQTYDRNVITASSASNVAGGNGAFGITMDNGGTMLAGTHNVTNNIIKMVGLTNSTALDGAVRGINVNTVATDIVKIEHNSVDLTESAATAATAGRVAGIIVPATTFAAPGTLTIQNNIVRVGETDATTPAAVIAPTISLAGGAAQVTCVGNTLFAVGPVFARTTSTNHADIAAWRTANPTFDTVVSGGQSVDPASTATFSPAWNANLHFTQVPIPNTTFKHVAASTTLVDVDGDARPSANAIAGADQPTVDHSTVTEWQNLRD